MYSETLITKFSIKVSSWEKTVKIFLLLLIIIPFSDLYPQYFIGQSQIDEFKLSKKKYYKAPESEYKDKYVYLYGIHVDGYLSDVKIGFDKERYKNGEPITVTLELGNESKEDSVRILVYGGKVSSEQVKLPTKNGYNAFNIKKGENVKIVIDCGTYNPNRNGSIIDFQINNIQRSPAASEDRQYDIIYDKNPTEQEKRNAESRKGRVIERIPVDLEKGSTRKFPGSETMLNSGLKNTAAKMETVNDNLNAVLLANDSLQSNKSVNKEFLIKP